ncbi:MerR family transcriptional regulator [Budvicia aquatica]|uniref:MerR family transcriptional regulator n=1 Tax=Budvicia aquatica TaxID=82979 RepID=UPI00106A69C3
MITPDETYFNIAETARMVGVTTTTIRNWEKHNLFLSKRASNGYRIFSLHDIDILKKNK